MEPNQTTLTVPYEVRLVEDGDICRLEIVVDDAVIERHWDHGEPEDNMFCRDWAWVPTALEDAFKRGAEYGQKLIKQSPPIDDVMTAFIKKWGGTSGAGQ
jgi:hypothetical protein